jgi:tetratricopeptide (TPR) repeat protein
MAFADVDVKVRSSAILALSSSYCGTDDVRIGALLATAVYDEGTPFEVRWFAYMGLFKLRRKRTSIRQGSGERPQSTRIPEDVDWPFVDTFLIPNRTASPVDMFDMLPEWMRNRYRSLNSGIAAYERGDFAEAIVHLTAALEQKPDAAGSLYRRGHSYLEIGNLDAAIADLTQAIGLCPTPACYYRRSDAYRRKGLIDLAEQDHEAAVCLDGKSDERRER